MDRAETCIIRSVQAMAEGKPLPVMPATRDAAIRNGSTRNGSTGEAPRFPLLAYKGLGRRALAARYRLWWRRKLPIPYGYCACGCGGKTRRAGWNSEERDLVAGEPRPFLPHHRKRWGHPELTDPNRKCSCGCGRATPVVRDGACDEGGKPLQFAGMRAKYLNAHHRPPPALPHLTLDTPLGDPLRATEEYGLAHEERIWLAEVADAHLSFARDRGKLRPKLQSTDQRTIRRFLLSSGRGRVDTSRPQRRGASPVYKWSGRSPLETANVLTRLHALLGPRSRSGRESF